MSASAPHPAQIRAKRRTSPGDAVFSRRRSPATLPSTCMLVVANRFADSARISTSSWRKCTLTSLMGAEETLVQSPIADSLIGKILRGTYLINETLDQGGMGMVFIAEHVRLRRKVAVKVLAKHLVNDQHALARFHREAEIISQL